MSFESLSENYHVVIEGFPQEWIPLTYLYDPDLPLFPIQYFHFIDPVLPIGQRPNERERIFGFIKQINLDGNKLTATVATNKNLHNAENKKYLKQLTACITSRVGLENPVIFSDIENSLVGNLENANNLIKELWYQVVSGSFGNSLPFGKMWDPVFGLIRFVASWNSQGGRKGELIQTHDFMRSFGEKLQTGGGTHADFYLLPTFDEIIDSSNPLSYFKEFSKLTNAASDFTNKYCDLINIDTLKFSSFKRSIIRKRKGSFDTADQLHLIDSMNNKYREVLFNNYSAFNRGPVRPVIFLMMLDDLRQRRWHPLNLNAHVNGKLYIELQGTTQSPKVIELYAQQCFGNESVLPIDEWIEIFSKWPLNFNPSLKKNLKLEIFNTSAVWGKIERLIWIASQARKVHSSVAENILWCVRFGAPKESEGKAVKLRGANPLSCKICDSHIRNICPAYKAIENKTITFNSKSFKKKKTKTAQKNIPVVSFNIITSDKSNTSIGQQIKECEGEKTKDIYSTRDRPKSFNLFPMPGHDGSKMTVNKFIDLY